MGLGSKSRVRVPKKSGFPRVLSSRMHHYWWVRVAKVGSGSGSKKVGFSPRVFGYPNPSLGICLHFLVIKSIVCLLFFTGKTTQVPQYLLEHAKLTQTPVKIICTEPRRIAAVSMAERVSEECGTQVRFFFNQLFVYIFKKKGVC